jgi:D-alanine-D-alanine ligase
VAEAGRHDRKIIVEKAIEGREIECGILGNDRPLISVFGEILAQHEFYDYDAKYTDGLANLLIPASLLPEQVRSLTDIALRAFRAIDAEGMARVDFFLERESGNPVLNEINTIPGFTRTSMFPKLWEATGISYSELIERLVELALEPREMEL